MHRGVCECVEHVGEQLEFDRHYFFRNIPSFPFPPLPLEASSGGISSFPDSPARPPALQQGDLLSLPFIAPLHCLSRNMLGSGKIFRQFSHEGGRSQKNKKLLTIVQN